jgi:fructose/tagatose bisphosphate aldolase
VLSYDFKENVMKAGTTQELFDWLEGVVRLDNSTVTVLEAAQLPGKIDKLVYSAVFSDGLTRDMARWLIWEIAQAVGVYPSSIHELYLAIGRGDVPPSFTVPAMNVRAMNFTTSRAIFRAANKLNVGAMIFEIARSEIGYTGQRPSEYVSCVLGAAIKEGYRGPVYIQGDHFQVSAAKYKTNPDAEIQAVKDIMTEAVEAGFYNIDIDTSTLVDLSYDTLAEQQRVNYEQCAVLTRYAREIEPEGITISLGGEIGEVGHKNSTVEELHAFMQGYRSVTEDVAGISKISVQTGTSHGGVVLPDGTLAQVQVDFDTLRDLSTAARDVYGLGGAVQHGASTLPAEAFGKFPEIGTVEIHLATNFQNMVFDLLPKEMVEESYAYVKANFANEWKTGKTEDQFIYSTRKKVIGPFKEQWWHLPDEQQRKIGAALQEQFEFLFDKLNVKNTRQVATELTPHIPIHKPRPAAAAAATAEEDVSDLDD